MKENLKIYEQVRTVPSEAQKPITGGRLRNMTDINPMWRIKTLTEQFGVCGVGWKYEIVDKIFKDGANGEIATFVDIALYIKVDGEWSDAIPGTGGSSFVSMEKDKNTDEKKPYVSDECFKMALTDALSVACKALGIGADVYWQKDANKYDKSTHEEAEEEKLLKQLIDKSKVKAIESMLIRTNTDRAKLLERYHICGIEEMTNAIFVKAMKALENTLNGGKKDE